MANSLTSQPLAWISSSAGGFLAMILTFLILKIERNNRDSTDIAFPSRLLQISSLLCIIFGALYGASKFVFSLNGFCYFGLQLSYVSVCCQLCFMGMYQLSTLTHCLTDFATSDLTRTYIKHIMFAQYIIGTLLILNGAIGPWLLLNSPHICEINSHLQSMRIYSHPEHKPLYIIWVPITVSIYILWSVISLSLYTFMVRSYTHARNNGQAQSAADKNTLSLLHKMLILTVMYQTVGAISVGTNTIVNAVDRFHTIGSIITANVFYIFETVSVSLAMFLMQSHNTLRYKAFLKVSSKCGMYHVCCCCLKSMVKQEITIKTKQSLEQNVEEKHNKTQTKEIRKTNGETKTQIHTMPCAKI
eukprot:58541_1